MPATQIKNGEWFYNRGDIREISQSAQGSNRGSQRLSCWHTRRDGVMWSVCLGSILQAKNEGRGKRKIWESP